MYRSPSLSKMATTMGGMRRLLKKPVPAERWLRQAVESGVYRSPDAPTKEPRRRQRHGAQIQDYPIEYQILKLNPPIPTPPRTPKALREERRRRSQLPTEPLVAKYLKRQHEKEVQNKESGPQSVQEYYERLLGVPPPPASSALGQKSSMLNKAYAFAVKQYEVMRLQDMSEEESLAVVEDLLQQQDTEERRNSRSRAKSAAQWRAQQQAHGVVKKTTRDEESTSTTTAGGSSSSTAGTESSSRTDDDSTSVPSVLHGNPRAVQGMTLWSKRLEAVPYKEWTVGATVALDHWIARSVLGLTEETWDELLEGGNPSLTSRGRDILSMRHALFPETILSSDEEQEAELEAMAAEEDTTTSTSDLGDKSIDELLAHLGGFDESEAEQYWKEDTRDRGGNLEDDEVTAIINELQMWRAEHARLPYDKWSGDRKEEFKDWVKKYALTFAADANEKVDLEATRKALLSQPPMEREESDELWDHIRDEAEAEIFLQTMLKQGPPTASGTESEAERKARLVFATFAELPYKVQLQKLVDLGTLRPLLDEYTSEVDRIKFLQRHGDKLLEGLELEHLVPDPEGPISGQDLGSFGEDYGIQKEDRFRLELIPYGTSQFGSPHNERARQIYRAWNAHKVGRARYEETMFKRKKLGLRYNRSDSRSQGDV